MAFVLAKKAHNKIEQMKVALHGAVMIPSDVPEVFIDGHPLKPRKPRIQFTDPEIGRHARKAARIIRERGWTRGTFEASTGEVCAIGAFDRAVAPIAAIKRIELRHAFNARFAGWLQENHGEAGEGTATYRVPAWNDLILREDTVLWLEKFADAMDPQR